MARAFVTPRAQISRRDLIKMGAAGGAIALGGSILAACTGQTSSSSNTAVANAAQGKQLNAGMSNGGLAVDWYAQGKDVAEWWSGQLNTKLTWYDGQLDPVKQNAALMVASNKTWDWFAIAPQQAGTITQPVKQIIGAGTPMFQMISLIGAPTDNLDVIWIEQSSYEMGFQVTTALATAIGSKGNIIITQGPSAFTGAQERTRGFHDALKNFPGVKILAEDFADWDPNKSQALWRSYLNKWGSGQIQAGYFENDQMALAAQQVMQQAGRASEIKIGGADGMPPAIAAVKNGTMVATIRHSSSRMHQLPVILGFLLGHGLVTKSQVPNHLRMDGPVITHDDTLWQDTLTFFEKIFWM